MRAGTPAVKASSPIASGAACASREDSSQAATSSAPATATGAS
jgi:hypothetical protein